MGTFTERMESTIQGILSSQEARRSDLEAVLKDARSMLQEFQSQHQGMAADVRTFLNLSRKSLFKETRSMLNDFRGEHESSAEELRDRLGISVSELKSNVHNLMKRFNMIHKNMAGELRENLESNRKDRADFVCETLERFRGQMDELDADIQEARELWLRRRTTTPTGPKLEVKKRVFEREERIPEIKKVLKKRRK